MNFLKKARGHVKGAVQELHDAKDQWNAQQQNNHELKQPQTSQQLDTQRYNSPSSHQQPYHASLPIQDAYSSQQPHQAHYAPPSQYSQPRPPIQHPRVPNSPAPSPGHYSAYPGEQQPRRSQALSPQQAHETVLPQRGPECLAVESSWIETVPFYVLNPNVRSQMGSEGADELIFAVCANCHTSQINPHSNLASSLVRLEIAPPDPNGMALISYREAKCEGNIPRVRKALQRCVAQNSMQPIFEWIWFSKTLSGCNGSPTPYTEGRWESQHAGSTAICKYCFELFIRGTDFERQFHFTQGSVNTEFNWMCDAGRDCIVSKVLIQEVNSSRPNFQRWAAITKAWCELPSCPGDGIALEQMGSKNAYVAQDGQAGFFCPACYEDCLLGTPFEAIAKLTELDDNQLATIPCNLGSAFAKFAMKRALKRGDYTVWSKAATLNGKVPECAGVLGVDESELRHDSDFKWYRMREHPGIEVCPACYHICIELFGVEGLLESIDRPLVDGLVRQCFLTFTPENQSTPLDDPNGFTTTIAWRGRMLRDGIAYFYDSGGDSSVLKGYAEKIDAMPRPCFSNARAFAPPNERNWFGKGADKGDPHDFNFTMCEECFINCVRGRAGERMVNGDSTAAVMRLSGGFVCNAYSSRTRRVLKEAMTNDNWSHFQEHWNRREEIRARLNAAKQREAVQMQKALALKARVDAEGQMLQIGLMQQLNANTNATISGVGGSVAEAASMDYGQRFGNSTVGYGHLTHNGARAAMDRQQAIQFAATMPVKDVRLWTDSGDVVSDSFVLSAIIDEVTKEWQDIE